MNPLQVQRMHVRKGVLDIEVSCEIDALHVTEEQADLALELLPNLARHVCVNDSENDSFGTELVGTELPHLLEHLIIELQGKARTTDAAPTLIGHTSWLEELSETAPRGYALMRTSVSFENDFVALAAANAAVGIVEWLCSPGTESRPDIAEIIQNLAAQ